MGRRLLITVGTTRFDSLIQIVTSSEFLSAISSLQITEIIIQHGSSPIQTPPHPKLRCHPYIPNLPEVIESCDIVIGHAGSGTVLDVIRGPIYGSGKRPILVVIPNENLMGNHQRELAEGIEELGLGFVCWTVKDLPRFLSNIKFDCNYEKLTRPNPDKLNSLIRNLLIGHR